MKISDVLKSRVIALDKPVLSPGDGRSWDNKGSMTPSPWKEEDEEYLMYYIGQSYQHDHWLIGLADSCDLMDWHKQGKASLVDFRNKKMDHIFIDCPSLVKKDDRYYVFYEAKDISLVGKTLLKSFIKKNFICKLPISLRRNMINFKRSLLDSRRVSLAIEHAFGRSIYLAILDKYDDFSNMEAKKVFSPASSFAWDCKGVFSPRVFSFNKKFYLLYGGSNGKAIGSGLAVSEDLLHWQRHLDNPILKNGKKGDWDENHALLVDILELEDGYCGFYEGEDVKNNFRIGIAYSHDLINWEKFKGNPIIELGEKGSFKEKMVCGPRAIQKDNQIFIFHAAHNRYMSGFCGLAILES